MTRPDSTLVRACLSGERDAWERLVNRYSRLIYGMARRCGLNEDDAGDVFQSVCVKLLANLEKLKDDRHLTGWLIITGKNECSRLLRQRNRIHSTDSSVDGEESDQLAQLAADDPYPVEVILQLEEEQLVRRAVESLGARCREMIELLYLTDPPASYADVAERLNLPVGSVGPTRARCLKTLKESLLKSGF